MNDFTLGIGVIDWKEITAAMHEKGYAVNRH